MGDERSEIGSNVVAKGNTENQCSMSSNNNNNTIPSMTHHFTTNATNNNNNNNEKKDQFLHVTNTVNSILHFSTNGSNNNNIDEQEGFFPISTTTNTNPFTGDSSNNSSSSNNNDNEQDHFLPISSNNNIQHFLSNATTKSSNSNNNDHFLLISSNNNIQHFLSNATTKSSNSNNKNNNIQHFLSNATIKSSNSSNNNNKQGRCPPISTKACSSNTCNNSNKEQDRFLPIANVGRIMKKFIPGNGKISKDAKETVQECVSEFISFITGEASDKCQREKRKTINGDDIIWAITTLGFEDYVNPLRQYLNKYREMEGEKLNVPKQQRFRQHDQKPDMSYHIVYSSTGLLSQPSFLPNDQSFPLPFSQNQIQTQLPQHEHIDSIGNW